VGEVLLGALPVQEGPDTAGPGVAASWPAAPAEQTHVPTLPYHADKFL